MFVFQREEGGYTYNGIELQISGTEHILCSILNAYNWGERERVPPWEFNAPSVCLYIYIYIYIVRPSFLVPRPPRYAQT